MNRVFGKYKSKTKYYAGWKYLYTISLQGLGRQQGSSTDTSGESYILKQVFSKPNERFVIIDVGANKGQYSLLVMNRRKAGAPLNLHLFEPSPSNVQLLQKEFNGKKNADTNITINELALSNSAGQLSFFSDEQGSDLGSLFDLRVSVRPFDKNQTITVNTITLDEYARQHNIDTIDLLKIDVEGAELSVLQGATQLLKDKRIRSIQFEFGTGNISSRVFFIDFWQILSPAYRIYHIQQDGLVEIDKYNTELEVFKTTNYYAALK